MSDVKAPSQGGDLDTWIPHQLAYSQQQAESYHRGVVETLLEVRAGLAAERRRARQELEELQVVLVHAARLDAHVRYDADRPDGAPRWTAWVPGKGRGDGNTPAEALGALRARLEGARG